MKESAPLALARSSKNEQKEVCHSNVNMYSLTKQLVVASNTKHI